MGHKRKRLSSYEQAPSRHCRESEELTRSAASRDGREKARPSASALFAGQRPSGLPASAGEIVGRAPAYHPDVAEALRGGRARRFVNDQKSTGRTVLVDPLGLD